MSNESACHASRLGKPATLQPREHAWYGWRPELPDARDLLFVPRATRLPASVDLRSDVAMPPIWDQGPLGSCTAHGVGAAYEYTLRKAGYTDYSPSRLFIYYNERVLEGTVNEDAGAEIRDGMKVLSKLGAPHETLWPYNVSRFATKPSPATFADGLKHQCITYQSVSVNETAVRTALAKGQPVVVGFTVYESFESDAVAATGVVPKPKRGETVLGGHCVLVVGYETLHGALYAICRNSWADDWGDKGYFYLPLAWLCNTDNADDFWTISKVEG